MSNNIVVTKSHLRSLLAAAHNIQTLMNDGTLTAAWGDGKPDEINEAVSTFDALTERAARLESEDKTASPFLRYRTEILGHYETAERLRKLTLNLWGGVMCNLSQLFMGADERHTRIALELIVSYSQYGENDTFFMGLASEIVETMQQQEQVAA